MSHPMAPSIAPYGPTAPSADASIVTGGGGDVALDPPGRGFKLLTDGVVSVVTLAGNTRTFTGVAGWEFSTMISTVKDATAASLWVYQN